MLVTHDQDEALSLADRVAVLRAGGSRSAPAPRRFTSTRSTRLWPASSATPTCSRGPSRVAWQ